MMDECQGSHIKIPGIQPFDQNESKNDDSQHVHDVQSSIIQKDVDFIIKNITDSCIGDEPIIDEDHDEKTFLSSPITFLPREIIIKIFAYLSHEELSSNVSLVCKLWLDYALDPVLWKTIDLHEHRCLPSVQLCRMIARATSLKTLILHGRVNLSESEVIVFTDFTSQLRHLDVGFCGNLNSSMLTIIVDKCPMLESINIEGVTSGFKPGCLQVLSRCQHLTSMNFSHSILDNDDLFYLAKHLKCIKTLNIDGISWIEEEPVKFLVEQHTEYLEDLVIDGAEISDTCYKAIGSCLNLVSFESSFCEQLTDRSLFHLQNLTNLRHLRLRKGIDFSTGGLISLFQSPAVTNLTSLDLTECTGCNDVCVQQITKSCGSTLKDLSLCWCWFITDVGLNSIVDHCRNVVKLDLTGIDKIVGDCFGRVPTEMPYLKLLDLRQCNRIKDELIEAVIREKRDLIAINYYGEEMQYG